MAREAFHVLFVRVGKRRNKVEGEFLLSLMHGKDFSGPTRRALVDKVADLLDRPLCPPYKYHVIASYLITNLYRAFVESMLLIG